MGQTAFHVVLIQILSDNNESYRQQRNKNMSLVSFSLRIERERIVERDV